MMYAKRGKSDSLAVDVWRSMHKGGSQCLTNWPDKLDLEHSCFLIFYFIYSKKQNNKKQKKTVYFMLFSMCILRTLKRAIYIVLVCAFYVLWYVYTPISTCSLCPFKTRVVYVF